MFQDDDPGPPRLNLLAPILAWVGPGLGQWSLGHRGRALRIAAGLLLLYVGGLLVGGLDVVNREEARLWFWGQAVAGPATYLIDAWRQSHPTPASPDQTVSHVYATPSFAHASEIGRLATTLAGMLNVMVMLDALVRPRAAREATATSRPSSVRPAAPSSPTPTRRAEDRA